MKITITRLLETSKILATKVGQEIPDFFKYMAEFVEQVTRALRQGLTFGDNFNCTVKSLSLKHAQAQVLEVDKTVTGIIPVRVSSQRYGLDTFGWYYDSEGELTVMAKFSDATNQTPTDALAVAIVILF